MYPWKNTFLDWKINILLHDCTERKKYGVMFNLKSVSPKCKTLNGAFLKTLIISSDVSTNNYSGLDILS